MGKNVITFGVGNSSSAHADNRKKDILVLGRGPAQRLDQTAITAKHKYSINVTRSRKKTLLKSAL